MKKILALCLIAGSCAAFADQTGLYVGAGAGVNWNNQNYGDAASFRLDGGYNFTDSFAVELGTTGITQNGGVNDQSIQFYDLSLKGTLPLGDTFALVGQIGGAYGSPGLIHNVNLNIPNNYTTASWDGLVAAGAQINVTRSFSLNLMDYNYMGSSNTQGYNNVLLAGAQLKF